MPWAQGLAWAATTSLAPQTQTRCGIRHMPLLRSHRTLSNWRGAVAGLVADLRAIYPARRPSSRLWSCCGPCAYLRGPQTPTSALFFCHTPRPSCRFRWRFYCVPFQGKVEACHPGRIELYDGEWFTCSWKICNSGGLVFPTHTRLSRVSRSGHIMCHCSAVGRTLRRRKEGCSLFVLEESEGRRVCRPGMRWLTTMSTLSVLNGTAVWLIFVLLHGAACCLCCSLGMPPVSEAKVRVLLLGGEHGRRAAVRRSVCSPFMWLAICDRRTDRRARLAFFCSFSLVEMENGPTRSRLCLFCISSNSRRNCNAVVRSRSRFLFFLCGRFFSVPQSSDEYSGIGGAEFVMVNPLRPGEEQVVSVMQQAPNHVSGTDPGLAGECTVV